MVIHSVSVPRSGISRDGDFFFFFQRDGDYFTGACHVVKSVSSDF